MPEPHNDRFSRWYESATFTSDWTSAHFETWAAVLAPLRDRPVQVLEIGAFEGRSAIFFLEYLSLSRIVCVDRFSSDSDPGYEQRFRLNTKKYNPRLKAIKGDSAVALLDLLTSSRRFDLIYIDGSHARDDVLIDSLLSWRLLRVGGIIIWDDYELDISPYIGPRQAIDLAQVLYQGCFVELHRGKQVIVQKTRESQTFFRTRTSVHPVALLPFLSGEGPPRTPANLLRIFRSWFSWPRRT
jgi:predicted O-methyltransferase YrrM